MSQKWVVTFRRLVPVTRRHTHARAAVPLNALLAVMMVSFLGAALRIAWGGTRRRALLEVATGRFCLSPFRVPVGGGIFEKK